MHHKLKWNVAKETEKCEEVTKNLVKIKKLFDVAAKNSAERKCFSVTFSSFRLRLFFWVFRIAFLSLEENEKSQGKRIGTKAGDFKWKTLKIHFLKYEKMSPKEWVEVSHDNASIIIKRDCFMLPIDTLGRNFFLFVCCYFLSVQCQDNWRVQSVDVKR